MSPAKVDCMTRPPWGQSQAALLRQTANALEYIWGLLASIRRSLFFDLRAPGRGCGIAEPLAAIPAH